MNTVQIRFINSQSDNGVQTLTVPDTGTIRNVLDMNRVNLDNTSVTVKVDGERIDYDLDDTVQVGMVITVTPEQIKGA